jgi:hypothetical protein
MCKQRLPAPRWPVQEHAARGRDARVHVHLRVLQRERDELEEARDRAARAADDASTKRAKIGAGKDKAPPPAPPTSASRAAGGA